VKTLEVTVRNLSFLQPFSPFLVVVHNEDAPPLFIPGDPASSELAILAEDGDATPAQELYDGMPGVLSSKIEGGAPPGATFTFAIEVNNEYPLVTLASMAVNTNDCFVALNGVRVYEGQTIAVPGYDSGSEFNDELCTNIPGPACGPNSGNGNEPGEGFVHIHRGFQSINVGRDDLTENELGANNAPLGVNYDWRNPMASFSFNEPSQ